MRKFRSFALKLAVIDALLEKGFLGKEMTALQKQIPEKEIRTYYADHPEKAHDAHPGVSNYFADLEIPDRLLNGLKSLSFEGGNEIYRIVAPDWDGEDDQFLVRDLSDLIHLPNLESLDDTVLLDVEDATVLLKLQKLSSVDIQYGGSIRDKKTIGALEAKGVRIENKALGEKSSAGEPDPELRLALDYTRAQDLLWDEDDPGAALELLEKILSQKPTDADSWFEKGNALDALGKPDQAAEAWEKSLQLKKKYPDANYNLANYYKDRGSFKEAELHIDTAIANGMKFSPEAWHIRGQLGLLRGRGAEAEGDLQKALKLYRQNLKAEDDRAENLYQIACVSALLQDMGGAVENLRLAIEADPSNAARAKDDPDLTAIM